MTPPRRRPATPPARRPKVAGLHRRADQPEQPDQPEQAVQETVREEETPALDVPVIGEEAEIEPEEKPEPAAEPEAAPADETFVDGAEPSAEEPQQPSLLIPAVLVVVALLLGGLGFWFMQLLSDARVGAGNEALSDTNTTKDVVGAANTAVVSVLSYKFDDMPAATARAKQYLAGEAVDQYDQSMKALETDIQTQKLQVVVNPVSVGVVSLSGDEARVLVFADQIGTRADKQPSGGPTQFAMNMRRVDGNWKIVKLDFFENPK